MARRRRLTRRAFLRDSAAATGALAAGFFGAGASPAPEMRTRTLGRTGLRVSEIGFGGYPVSDPAVIHHALDRGINYIDTAHCYRGGSSEEVIGEALRGRRDRVVLTTKWCPHHIGRPARQRVFLDMLDRSLRRLGTDHVDIVLNHEVGRVSDGEGLPRLRNPEMFAAFEAARKAGKARFLGVSGHDPDLMPIMHHAVDDGRFDVLLCRYSFLDYPDQDRLIEKAHAKGVGFIAMKTLAGAKGADLDRFRGRQTTFRQAALRWVLSNRRVSNLIISINSTRQVDEYAAASGQELTRADQRALEEYAAAFSDQVCRYCGACLPECPGEVRITDVLRFSMYHHEYGQEERAAASYARLLESERAGHCRECAGFCERACAYDLPVKTLLLRAHHAIGAKGGPGTQGGGDPGGG